jgi:hypothetical protein
MLVLGLLNEIIPFHIEEKPGCGAGGASSWTGWSESTQVLLRQDQSTYHSNLFTEPLDILRVRRKSTLHVSGGTPPVLISVTASSDSSSTLITPSTCLYSRALWDYIIVMTSEPPVSETCRCHRFVQESHICSQVQSSSICAFLEDGKENWE